MDSLLSLICLLSTPISLLMVAISSSRALIFLLSITSWLSESFLFFLVSASSWLVSSISFWSCCFFFSRSFLDCFWADKGAMFRRTEQRRKRRKRRLLFFFDNDALIIIRYFKREALIFIQGYFCILKIYLNGFAGPDRIIHGR